jgi:hypothetical protein
MYLFLIKKVPIASPIINAEIPQVKAGIRSLIKSLLNIRYAKWLIANENENKKIEEKLPIYRRPLDNEIARNSNSSLNATQIYIIIANWINKLYCGSLKRKADTELEKEPIEKSITPGMQ